MNDEAFQKTKKDRSPNFPFINLETALRRAQEFYDKEKRSAAPLNVAAKDWNYSVSSSGALQTVAALKSYGLMSDEGSGATRTVRLTELALRILLDLRPDSMERPTYMRQAALNPSVAADVYAKWPDGLPSDANMRHFLVFDLKFADQAALKVVKIIEENESLTGSFSSVIGSGDADTVSDTSGAKNVETAVQTQSRAQSIASGIPQVHMERIGAPDGTYVELRFSEAPTKEAYDFLEKYAAFRKGVMPDAPKATDAE
ncbi:MAG TPA: hypothetical protein VJ833_00925 [Rhodanobacteraceae bacterium]|nr:hypothetical protein [Rhodanobacteraceae bacterium]